MLERMAMAHQNDPDLVRDLLVDPGLWVVVGLSNNKERDAWQIARYLKVEQGKAIMPVHPKAETVHGAKGSAGDFSGAYADWAKGYGSISDIPDGTDVKVVQCFVNSDNVGAVVDEAIANKERLDIDAIWMQRGVVDVAAAARARKVGMGVVMDTCPKIEYPRLRPRGT